MSLGSASASTSTSACLTRREKQSTLSGKKDSQFISNMSGKSVKSRLLADCEHGADEDTAADEALNRALKQEALHQRSRTAVLVNIVSCMERMDEQIVPALSRHLGCALHASPHQLGLITFWRAVVQSLSSPIGGLAGHYYNRVMVLCVGAMIWGTFCAAFSYSTNVYQAMVFWSFNGLGLSLLIPNAQSLIADYYPAHARGQAFGMLYLTGAVGGMLGSVYATNMGSVTLMGMEGWRLAFMSVALVSIAMGVLALVLATDPRCPQGQWRQPMEDTSPANTSQHSSLSTTTIIPYKASPDRSRYGKPGTSAGGITAAVKDKGGTSCQPPMARSPGGSKFTFAGPIGGTGARPNPSRVGGVRRVISASVLDVLEASSGMGHGDAGDGNEIEPYEPMPAEGLLSVPYPAMLQRHVHAPEPASSTPTGGPSWPQHHALYAVAAFPMPGGLERSSMDSGSSTASATCTGGEDQPLLIKGSAKRTASGSASAKRMLFGEDDGVPQLGGSSKLSLSKVWGLLTVPTFLIIVVQGVVGSMPWNGLVFLTLYLQLLGMTDFAASACTALMIAGTAVGGLLGGWLGDMVGTKHPNHGRVLLVQASVASGVPLMWIVLRVLPMDGTALSVGLYGTMLLITGLLISWAAPACNNPIFAEIVPPSMRNLIYAFDRSFEGALAAMGAPLVGMAAERLGFAALDSPANCMPATKHDTANDAPASNRYPADPASARALGDAILLFTTVPWALCTLAYTGLHYTYPRDRDRARRAGVAVPSSALGMGH